MKFRTRSGSIRLATTSGHITWLTEEWRDLPEVFHAEAWASGCISEDMAQVLQGEEKPRGDKVKAAISQMVKEGPVNDKNYWTEAGVPQLKKLREIAGFEVTASERDQAWAEHQL